MTLANFRSPPLVDKAYRRSAKGRMCDVPGCEDAETVVLAHIATASNSGMGMKPPDTDSLFLCGRHHREMDEYPGLRAEWIVDNIVLPLRREQYEIWKWRAER